jgi:hypothetical protein
VQRRILELYVRRGLLTEADAHDMLTWRGSGGSSLDGSVRIAAPDSAGLERLVGYCPRPPSRYIDSGPRRTPRAARPARTPASAAIATTASSAATRGGAGRRRATGATTWRTSDPAPRPPRRRLHPRGRWWPPTQVGSAPRPPLRGPTPALPRRAPTRSVGLGEIGILAFLPDPDVVRPILRHPPIPERTPPPGRDPFDQSLLGDDGTWSA